MRKHFPHFLNHLIAFCLGYIPTLRRFVAIELWHRALESAVSVSSLIQTSRMQLLGLSKLGNDYLIRVFCLK